MSLSNKYGIPQETVKRMVQDGVISCSWPLYEDVYARYQELLKTGQSKNQIYYQISEEKSIPERTIRFMISKIGKI